MFANMKSDKQGSLLFKKCCLLAASLTKYISVNILKEIYHIVTVYFKTQYNKKK